MDYLKKEEVVNKYPLRTMDVTMDVTANYVQTMDLTANWVTSKID